VGNLSFEDACCDRQDIPDFGMPFIAEENYFNSIKGDKMMSVKQNRAEVVTSIMQCAFLKMGNSGYNGVSIQDLVNAIKKKKATFYNYFRSKEELVFTCLEFIQDVMMTDGIVPNDKSIFKFLASLAMHIDSLTPFLAINLKNLMLLQHNLMGKEEFIKVYGELIYSNVLHLNDRFS